MTSKISWFNAGLFKANLKRFKWGAVLYFLLLFLSVCVPLTTIGQEINFYDNLLMDVSWFAFAMTAVVPTVTALLVFMSIHKKKAAVFTYSLPVKRTAMYLTNIISGLALMLLPVLLTALILLCLSVSGASPITALQCLEWIGFHLFSLTTNYSLAVLAATLTGTTFSMLTVNFILQVLPLILVFGLDTLLESIILGYSGSESFYRWIIDCNYVVATEKLYRAISYDGPDQISAIGVLIYFATSLLWYVAAGFLHKFRKSENAGEMMAYPKTRGLFKGFVTVAGMIIATAIMVNTHTPLVTSIITILIVGSILYFGTEMVLSRTLKVKHAVKGYLAFMGTVAALSVVLGATHFFGYETYVPEINQIQSATAYYEWSYDQNEPMVEDKACIEKIVNAHKTYIQTGRKNRYQYYNSIKLVYLLKNGKRVERSYPVEPDNTLYTEITNNPNYRKAEFYASLPDKSDVSSLYTDQSAIPHEEINTVYSLLLSDFIEKGKPKSSYGYEKYTQILFMDYRSDENDFYGCYSIELSAQTTPKTYNWMRQNGYFE